MKAHKLQGLKMTLTILEGVLTDILCLSFIKLLKGTLCISHIILVLRSRQAHVHGPQYNLLSMSILDFIVFQYDISKWFMLTPRV